MFYNIFTFGQQRKLYKRHNELNYSSLLPTSPRYNFNKSVCQEKKTQNIKNVIVGDEIVGNGIVNQNHTLLIGRTVLTII